MSSLAVRRHRFFSAPLAKHHCGDESLTVDHMKDITICAQNFM